MALTTILSYPCIAAGRPAPVLVLARRGRRAFGLPAGSSHTHAHLLSPIDTTDTDAALAKMKLNWRTALIVAELEDEIEALARGRAHRRQLKARRRRQLGCARTAVAWRLSWQASHLLHCASPPSFVPVLHSCIRRSC